MKYDISAACGCEIGRVRKNNEDNFLFDGKLLKEENGGQPAPLTAFYSKTEDTVFFCVFDGMGGEADGQVASHMAAQEMKRMLDQRKQGSDPVDFLRDAVDQMNKKVGSRAEAELTRMGTTAVIGCFTGRRLIVCNVGDSRAFLVHRNKLRQVSTDHTDEAFLISQGITKRKPRLTQYVGLYEEDGDPVASFYETTVSKGDTLLLCSDGITDMVPEQEILRIINTFRTPVQAVQTLIETAMQNGGRDNATALLARIGPQEKRSIFGNKSK